MTDKFVFTKPVKSLCVFTFRCNCGETTQLSSDVYDTQYVKDLIAVNRRMRKALKFFSWLDFGGIEHVTKYCEKRTYAELINYIVDNILIARTAIGVVNKLKKVK